MLRAVARDPLPETPPEASNEEPLEFTGERFVPGTGGSIELEHLHRYAFARTACVDKVVLDIACGEGYGSSMLALVAKSVIGVDIAPEAIDHARRRYSNQGVEFKVGSCTKIPLGDASVDVVVSFETIEHIDEHQQMMREIRRVLRPGGLLIISSPERFEYSERPGTVNEFHVRELYRQEFVDLVAQFFPHSEVFHQKVLFGSAILAESRPTRAFGLHTHESIDDPVPGLARPVYLIAIASDVPLPPMSTGVFEQPLAETPEWAFWIDTVRDRDLRIQDLDAKVAQSAGNGGLLEQDSVDLQQARGDLQRSSGQLQQAHLQIMETQARLIELQREAIASTKELLEERSRHQETAAHRDQVQDDLTRWRDSTTALEQQLRTAQEGIRNAQALAAHYENAWRSEQQAREAIYRSSSWRITAPLRSIKDFLRMPRRAARRARESALTHARSIYHRLPLSKTFKYATKNLFFSTFGFALKSTGVYRDWMRLRSRPDFPSTAVQQFTATDTVIAESSALAPTYSATGTPLWVADGVREWSDLPVMRERISKASGARRAAFVPTVPATISFEDEPLHDVARRLAFDVCAEPTVTILIPVFNHIRLTLECLAAIRAARTDVSYEILVADDASTDETESVLREVRNISVHRNAVNLNFLRNCNAALPLARGKYVVFLNNDVQVQEGWLDAMLATFDQHDRVGAVGPRIIYPSGHLQEAGVALNTDMTADMIGLADDPDRPEYSYSRRVDYSSGACLMLTRALLAELDGFCEDFAPAYCEDSDLCLRVQEKGLFVYYAPGATVVHRLSATTAAMDDVDKRNYIARNLVTLADKWQQRVDRTADVRSIAFYLPQFHPFPENDHWWGKGFTEWSNVARAQANFVGHYQPHLPADLGFYDLRIPEVMEEQVDLARRYGLGGFCFYYYWFGGKRLLDLPLERMLETGKPDFPFCLCWANENWTRRWDGQDDQVLMAQSHSDEDDEAVILDLIRYFRSPNYIRIDGRPLLVVYRVTLFPDFARTATLWREVCRREGVGEIYLSMVESFDLVNADFHPSRYGCDASIEFPPQGLADQIKPGGDVINPDFLGSVGDYRELALRYCTRESPAYTRFRGAMPGWDNTPRRQNNSFCFEHATPGAFQAWLEHILEETRRLRFGDERIVFVNAWNEWAEGAHLEPDRRFGHTFLEALQNAKEARSLLRMQRYAFD